MEASSQADGVFDANVGAAYGGENHEDQNDAERGGAVKKTFQLLAASLVFQHIDENA